jgi:hypothetical protein
MRTCKHLADSRNKKYFLSGEMRWARTEVLAALAGAPTFFCVNRCHARAPHEEKRISDEGATPNLAAAAAVSA